MPDERRRVDYIVERLNAEFQGRVRIETIRWETSYYSAHATFQKQIPEAAECDVVVAVFGARLGTPLPADFPKSPSGEPYPSGTAYEVLSAIDVRKAGREIPDVYVFRHAGSPVIKLDAPDRADIEAQWQRLTAFFERWFRTTGGEFIAAFHDFSTTDDFAAKVEDCLRQWLARNAFSAEHRTWDRVLRGSPFPGLSAFGEAQAPVFFGRDLAISQALARLRGAGTDAGHVPFLLMIGASGSGKSSLLRAGLLPRILLPGSIPEIDLWRPAIMVPGQDPFLSLATSLFDAAALGGELSAGSFRSSDLLAKQLAADPDIALAPVRDALAIAAARRQSEAGFDTVRPARLLLAIDQGERLFSEAEPGYVEAFGRLLTALVRWDIASVIFVLRSDAYAHFQGCDDLVALRDGGATFDVLPPSLAELEEIVTKPVALCRPALAFEQRDGISLGTQLVRDARGGDALPLLQMTLARLYAAEVARGDGFLRFADYHGMDAAVTETANEALASVAPDARAQLPALVTQLIADVTQDPIGGGTLLTIVPLERAGFEAVHPGRRALVEAFVAKRLFVAEGEGGRQRVRPVHEALLRIWPEAAAIVTEAGNLIRVRYTLIPIADAWAAAPETEKAGHLDISPALLSGAEALVGRFDADVTPTLRAFITASVAAARARMLREHEAQERRLRDAEALAAANRRTAQRTGLGLVFAVLLAGLALWEWHVAEAQQAIAVKQRDRAETALNVAIDAANHLVFDLGQTYRKLVGVPKTTIRDILQRAIDLQSHLANSGEASAALKLSESSALTETSNVLLDLGDATGALAAGRRAKALVIDVLAADPANADAERALFVANEKIATADLALGHLDDAMEAHRAAADVATKRLAIEPTSMRWQRDLGSAYDGIGLVYTERLDYKNALQAFQQSLKLAEAVAKATAAAVVSTPGTVDQVTPDTLAAQRDLSVAYSQVGMAEQALLDVAGAEAALTASLRIAEERAKALPDDIQAQTDLGVSAFRLGDLQFLERHYTDALASYRVSLPIFTKLANADATDLGIQRSLATNQSHIGDVLVALGRAADARVPYDQALAISQKLVAATPANTIWQRDLSVAFGKVADGLMLDGKATEALADYESSLAIIERLLESDPTRELWLADRGLATARIGDADVRLGKMREAEAAYRASLEVRLQLAATYTDNLSLQNNVAIAETNLGDFLSKEGRLSEAMTAFTAAETTTTALAAAQPDNAIWQRAIAIANNRIANVLLTQQQPAEALDRFQKALGIEQALARRDPGSLEASADLAFSHGRMGDVQLQLKRFSDAVQSYRAAQAAQQTLVAAAPDNLDVARELAVTDNKIGAASVADGRLADGAQATASALEIVARLRQSNPANVIWRDDLQFTFQQLGATGALLLRARDFTGALAAADACLGHPDVPVWINLLRANALMFLGRAEDAKAVHALWRGKKLFGEMLWEEGVAANFKELKDLGLQDALMDEILASFAQK